MAFLETARFPTNISFGSTGGPRYNTTITVVSSGHEYNNINWEHARHIYDVSTGIRSQSELSDLIKFFHIVRGKGHRFRYKDWSDYKSCDQEDSVTMLDQLIGYGDDITTTYQLLKTYDLSYGLINERIINKPVKTTILISVNGILKVEDTYTDGISNNDNDYWIDYSSGLVTFNAPPAVDLEIRWGGEFDVPCRFDTDELNISLDYDSFSSIPSIPIVEVRV